jgi:HEAT repeat protein
MSAPASCNGVEEDGSNDDPRTPDRVVDVRSGRRYSGWLGLPLAILASGCSIAPKSFQGLAHPAAIVRARAVGLGTNLPDSQVIPPLLDHLDDPDAVVRLSAHEELRKRTGQEFGYVPWADAAERAPAVARWRAWWNARKATLVKSARIP